MEVETLRQRRPGGRGCDLVSKENWLGALGYLTCSPTLALGLRSPGGNPLLPFPRRLSFLEGWCGGCSGAGCCLEPLGAGWSVGQGRRAAGAAGTNCPRVGAEAAPCSGLQLPVRGTVMAPGRGLL